MGLWTVRHIPPLPWGDGRGEAPGRGFGGEPKCGRADLSSAGRGVANPTGETVVAGFHPHSAPRRVGRLEGRGACVDPKFPCLWEKVERHLLVRALGRMPGGRRGAVIVPESCRSCFIERVREVRRRGVRVRRCSRHTRWPAAGRRACGRRPPRLSSSRAARRARRA